MADKKTAVVSAYFELAQSLSKASIAASDYAQALNLATDPETQAELVANPPGFPLEVLSGKQKGKHASPDSDDEKKPRKKRKQKDPNAPKRPASAYLEFQNSVRTQFREDDPSLPYPEVLRKIASTWNGMSEDDKKTWTDITAAKTSVWEEAKAAYKQEHGDDIAVDDGSSPRGTPSGAKTTIGKDGKEYTGKKRGRKSKAEKEAEASRVASDPHAVTEIAKAVVASTPKEKKKKATKVEAKPAPSSAAKGKKAARVPTPDEESTASRSDDDDEESSDADSSDDDSDDDDSDAQAPIPVKEAPKSNGKKRKDDLEVKPKSKKNKTA